jgi:hypothetical protein
VGDYVSGDNLESCAVSSPVLKLKADDNPWRCDCDMKALFEYISKQVSEFSGFACKEPSTRENSSWTFLGQENCTVYRALNAEVETGKPTTDIPKSSVYSTSVIVDVTEETAINTHMPTSAQSVDTSLRIIWIFAIILIIMELINTVWVFLYIRKCTRPNEQTHENRGALLCGEDRAQRTQDTNV